MSSCRDKSCCQGATETPVTVASAKEKEEGELQSDHPLCLAVIRENGTDVVVFDASGRPRSFAVGNPSNSNSKNNDPPKLCFSSHGMLSDNDDRLLTPCFDNEGNHVEEIDDEEGCFCGVETSHLHAHLYDPKTCEAGSHTKITKDIGFLASQILHPTDSHGDQDQIGNDGSCCSDKESCGAIKDDGDVVLHIGVSDSMPKRCNAPELAEHLNDATRTCCPSDAKVQDDHGTRGRNVSILQHQSRVHKVQHEDHVDYLVHNPKTNELHLEHPCIDCGKRDVHGKFCRVGKRQLRVSGQSCSKSAGSDKCCDSDSCDKKGNRMIQMHFFEVATHPFSILEHFHGLFELHSDRVTAAEHVIPPIVSDVAKPKTFEGVDSELGPGFEKKGQPSIRSSFYCENICCSSETPLIQAELEELKGIHKVSVNVSLREILVDHDPTIVSAKDIVAKLSKASFHTTIKREGILMQVGGATKKATGTGRSAFFVDGICCASEIPVINSILEPIDGVNSVTVNSTTKMVYVNHNVELVSAKQVADALSGQGFPAEVRQDASASVSVQSSFVTSVLVVEVAVGQAVAFEEFFSQFDTAKIQSFVFDEQERKLSVHHNPFLLAAPSIAKSLSNEAGVRCEVVSDGADPKTWSLGEGDAFNGPDVHLQETHKYPRPTVILSGICWIISMLSYVGGNWSYLKYVGIASVVVGLPPIAIKSYRTLKRCQFDANCLMLFAALGAVGLQEFPEAAAVVFLFSLSEWLEVRATTRARRALSAIIQLRPDKARVVHPSTKELIDVPASLVPVGAIVSVLTGDKIPCDGIIVEGVSTVDESSLTGESRPVRKGPGDEVSGGTANSGLTPLLVQTTATADDSAVSRLIRLVEEAQTNRSDTEKLVDEFAKYYTPIVVLAALFMITIPWAFGPETGTTWTNNGLILIVVACPCALVISTPVSYVAGLAATAQRGILIKGGAHLEALGLVKEICFDKTGTLTTGEFALLNMEPTRTTRMSREAIFQYLAIMEESASHPVAQAILKAAKIEKISVPRDMSLSDHLILEGEGVEGVVNGSKVYVGNERLFRRLGLLGTLSREDAAAVTSWKAFGGTVGFMGIDGRGIVCAFCAADAVRTESSEVLKSLRDQGIRAVMLTGDNRDAALAIGAQVGIPPDDVMSGLMPEEKLRHIESLSNSNSRNSVLWNPCSSRSLVMMCGDGVNDAPALAMADVGVAMGAGAALAMETADVTLLDSNLEKLQFSLRMGRRVINKIKQNILFSIAVKFTVLGFALAGKTNLWAAIGSDVGAMILVTLNAMLLLPSRLRRSEVESLKGDIEKANQERASLVRGEENSGSKGCCRKESFLDGCSANKTTSASMNHLDAKPEQPRTDCSSGCCAQNEAVDPKPVCSKGCCGADKAVEVEPPTVKTVSCCSEKEGCAEKQERSCCNEGGCDASTAKTKVTNVETSQKCCSKAPSLEVIQDKCCSKGCCDDAKASASQVAQGEVEETGCTKGCCGSSSPV